MKKLHTISYLGFVLLAFVLMSNNGGRANVANQGATGAPGEGTCGNTNCHDDGSFMPSLELAILDSDGNPAVEYFAGAEYTISLTTTANGASAYGFQVTSLNTSNDYFGNWETISNNGQVVELTNRTYVEQAGASIANSLTAKWSVDFDAAPGEMTFYASSNAVNINGSPGGDGTTLATLTIPQGVSSNKNLADDIGLIIAPNPASNLINVQMDEAFEAIQVLNILGKVVMESTEKTLDISSLANGTYLVRVQLENAKMATKKILKI